MEDAIFKRTSVRQFEERGVETEKVERLLKAGMAAPSAVNQQPWEFFVVTNAEMREKLGRATIASSPAGRAPVVLVPCMRKETRLPEFALIDLAMVTENILLEAEELGLGAVIMGVAPRTEIMKAVSEIVGIPEGLEPFAMVAVGWAAEGAKKAQQERWDEGRVHYRD